MVLCGIWHNQVIGPLYFEGSATDDPYLDMLDKIIPHIHSLLRRNPVWFQQDGGTAHYALQVRDFLNIFQGDSLGIVGQLNEHHSQQI